MNQWLWFVLAMWLGTGTLITAHQIAKVLKGRSK